MIDYIKTIRKKVGHDRIIIVGTGIIIYKDNKVLLQKRRDDSTWGFHGGSVDIGEKVEDAAKRELFEETGLTANNLEFIGISSGEQMMHTYPNGDKVYIIGITYKCNDFSGEPLDSSDEVLELKWFDIKELPENILKSNREVLENFTKTLLH